jgi:hypothetical protein
MMIRQVFPESYKTLEASRFSGLSADCKTPSIETAVQAYLL